MVDVDKSIVKTTLEKYRELLGSGETEVSINRKFKLQRGVRPGTLVADWGSDEELRPYLKKAYGGRLVAEGLSDDDITAILHMQELFENLINSMLSSNSEKFSDLFKNVLDYVNVYHNVNGERNLLL